MPRHPDRDSVLVWNDNSEAATSLTTTPLDSYFRLIEMNFKFGQPNSRVDSATAVYNSK